MKNKRILITGGDGFIGNSLCEEYQKKGCEVKNLSRRTDGDLLNFNFVRLFESYKPDIVIHCAGSPGVQYSIANPTTDFDSNVSVLHKMLFGLLECKDFPKIVFLSSAAVYGQPDLLPITERSEIKPISPYAMHKVLAEDICKYFIKQYGFTIEIVRIFSAYGPGLKKQIMWDIYQKIDKFGAIELFGTGEESRDFIFIDDLVSAIMLVAESSNSSDFIWNIASGKQTYIKEVAEIYAKIAGISGDKVVFDKKVRNGDPNNWVADISRLASIGFAPMVDIEEGIRRYYNWVQKV